MVDIMKIEQKVLELENFFSGLIYNSNHQDVSCTGAGVEYGLSCISCMKNAMVAYKKKPANKQLKIIYYGFTAIVRGIERFNNSDLEKQFEEITKETYMIQEELEHVIRW